MEHPVVLITGALTGIGRAAALAFAREEADRHLRSPRRGPDRNSPGGCGNSAPRPNSSAPTCATRTRCGQLVDQTVAAFRPARRGRQHRRHRRAPRSGHRAVGRQLCRDLRHQRARHAAQHEARTARDAGTRLRQHRQYLVDLRSPRRWRGVGLRGEQATPSRG